MNRIARWFALLLILVFALTACEPTTPAATVQPTATPAPTLAPTITPDAAQPLVLVLPGSEQQKTMIAVNRHYSDVVKHKGWNVDFYTVQHPYSYAATDSYIEYMAKQLASGAARADGYFVRLPYLPGITASQPLDKAKEQGLLYDCAAAAPQAAPQYWAKFQDQIVHAHYGLPICSNVNEPNTGFVLAVRNDMRSLATQEPASFTDMRALLDVVQKEKAEDGSLCARYSYWVDVWALQQGYMAIFQYAGIYAKADDPDARPLLLEDIPGFAAFLQDTFALRNAGQLVFTLEPGSGGKAPAMVLDDSSMFDSRFLPQSWKDYGVYPLSTNLSYVTNREFARYMALQSQNSVEMVIPAKGRRAADAMAFVQWAYAAQENGDCLAYGQLGEDFNLQGDRISFAPGVMERLTRMGDDYWPGLWFFGGIAQPRISVDAPENAEGLRTAWPKQQLAAPWLGYVDDTYLSRDDARQRILSVQENMMVNMQMGKDFLVDDWIKELRQATPADYLKPYVEALHQAQSQQQ